MADANDTMRYLVKSFDIAPAGTSEEARAATRLAEVFHEHGLETANKSFNYSSLGKVPQAALAALLGLAGILSGIGGAVAVVMFIIGLVMGGLYILELFGIKTVSRIGMKGSSQNVVARHPASSSGNAQKQRPVVVIAHYDTPRADIFALPVFAPIQQYLPIIVLVSMCADVVAMLFQMLPVPTVLHSIAWAISIVSSAILIVWAVCIVLQRFVMQFTPGANDNKASIAALYGLLDRVRPLQGGPGFGPNDTLYEAMDVQAEAQEYAEAEANDAHVRVSERRRARSGASDGAYTDEAVSDARASRRTRASREEAPAKPAPVRYGEEVVRSLGILPESCVITYEAAPAENSGKIHRASRRDAAVAEAVPGATVVISPLGANDAAEDETSVEMAPAEPLDPESAKDAQADAIMADIVGTGTLSGSQAPAVAPDLAGATSLMTPVESAAPAAAPAGASAAAPAPSAPVQPAVRQQPVQPFRVITSSDDYDAELRNAPVMVPPDVAASSAQASTAFAMDDPESPAARVVNDPTWGTTSFRPVAAGRRILGDIPDPAVAAVDPFSVSSIDAGAYNPDDFSTLDFETGTHQAVTPAMLEQQRRMQLDGFSADITEASTRRGRKNKKGRQAGRISQQAARMQAEMEEQSFNDWLGLDENFDAKTSGREIGSWENFEAGEDQYGGSAPQQPGRAGRWQGGAARARRERPSYSEADNAAPEVRRAAMTLGDRDLISHEIWFVLTGASEADHAGVQEFLRMYRGDLRGAYFVNLECVGAGRQSLVVEEGQGRHSKADRRLVNLFGEASVAINRPLALARMGWLDTEATPLLRQGCRAVTVAGVEKGAPAHARWSGDTAEKVDPAMVDDLVDVLVEVIKNA